MTRFDGGAGSVDGPFAGTVAHPPLIAIPSQKPVVDSSIRFDLMLTGPLSEEQLGAVAEGSIVEFGSDGRYLTVPEPAALALPALAALFSRRH